MSDDNQKGVGRGRPPSHSRFPKGTSGNPKGRPRKPRDLKKLVEAELDQTVALMRNGRQVHITKREFMINNLVNAAVRGDDKPLQALLKIIGTASEPEAVVSVDPAELARFALRYLPKPGTAGSGTPEEPEISETEAEPADESGDDGEDEQ